MSLHPPQGDLFVREVRLNEAHINDSSLYPFNLPAVQHLKALSLGQVTFIVGENGSGKSTLLESMAVAWGFNAEGGSHNFRFSSRESHSQALADALILVKGTIRPKTGYFFRAESFFNVATEIENLDRGGGGKKIIQSYGGRSLHEQSHGESFLSVFLHRFKENGFYILDEPEAALSPSRQMSFLVRLHELVKDGAQFIIATHSPILLSYPGAIVYELTRNGISKTDYKETENYQLYQQFLGNTEGMMRKLLD